MADKWDQYAAPDQTTDKWAKYAAPSPTAVPGVPDAADQMRTSALGKAGALMDRNPETSKGIMPSSPVAGGMAVTPPVALPDAANPASGVQHVAQGVEAMASPEGRDKARGAHEMIGGMGRIAAPFAPVAVAAAPVAAPLGAALGAGVGTAAKIGTKAAGAPEEYSDLAGDVAGIGAGGLGIRGLTKIPAKLPGLFNNTSNVVRAGVEALPMGSKALKFWDLARGLPEETGPRAPVPPVAWHPQESTSGPAAPIPAVAWHPAQAPEAPTPMARIPRVKYNKPLPAPGPAAPIPAVAWHEPSPEAEAPTPMASIPPVKFNRFMQAANKTANQAAAAKETPGPEQTRPIPPIAWHSEETPKPVQIAPRPAKPYKPRYLGQK